MVPASRAGWHDESSIAAPTRPSAAPRIRAALLVREPLTWAVVPSVRRSVSMGGGWHRARGRGPRGIPSSDPVPAMAPRFAAARFVTRRDRERGRGERPHEPPTHAVRCRTLVGRERELRWLADLLEVSRAGVTRLAVIEGKPGYGKTSLVNEFAAPADAVATVISVSATEDEQRLPFGFIHHLVDALHRRAPWVPRIE